MRTLRICALVILLLVPATAWACPGCKEALFDPGQLAQKLSTARGYAISIGLLLAVPFVLVAGTAALIVRAYRRRADPTGRASREASRYWHGMGR